MYVNAHISRVVLNSCPVPCTKFKAQCMSSACVDGLVLKERTVLQHQRDMQHLLLHAVLGPICVLMDSLQKTAAASMCCTELSNVC